MKKFLFLLLLCSSLAWGQAGCRKTAPAYSVNISGATTTTIVTGEPGKKIYVWQFSLENNHATTDVTVTWESNSTALNGAGNLLKANGGSWVQPCSGMAKYVTNTGESLNFVTSAAGTISGDIQYSVE